MFPRGRHVAQANAVLGALAGKSFEHIAENAISSVRQIHNNWFDGTPTASSSSYPRPRARVMRLTPNRQLNRRRPKPWQAPLTPRNYGAGTMARRRQPRGRRNSKAFGGGKYRKVGYYGRFNPSASPKEKKFVDGVVQDNFKIAATSIPTLNVVPQGFSESERVGRNIYLNSLHIKGDITKKSTTTAVDTSDMARVIIYVDHQCNGLAAPVADMLAFPVAWDSFRDLANSGRFTILMDKTIAVNNEVIGNTAAGTWETGERKYNFKFNKTFSPPLKITYSNVFDTGVLSTIESNNIGMFLIAHKDDATYFDSRTRIRYTD